jgi:hypothetical protein
MMEHTKKDDATIWRQRALKLSDDLLEAKTKIKMAKDSFDSIRHMGYVGDPHVDIAQHMYEFL